MVQDHDEDDVHWLRVPLDAATVARLHGLADMCHAEPISIAASLLHDVLKDDEAAHDPNVRILRFN